MQDYRNTQVELLARELADVTLAHLMAALHFILAPSPPQVRAALLYILETVPPAIGHLISENRVLVGWGAALAVVAVLVVMPTTAHALTMINTLAH